MTTCTIEKWNATPIYRLELDAFLKTPTGIAFREVIASRRPVHPPVCDNVNALMIAGECRRQTYIEALIPLLTEHINLKANEDIQSDYSEEPIQ